MYKYYNPHPMGLITDDCVKRAIVVATGKSYAEVQRELNRYKKLSGAKSFNSIRNLRYVEDVLKGEKVLLEGEMTANEFCKMYPLGRYILDMDGHWSASVDGIVYDTWDPGEETVNFVYHMKNEPFTPPNVRKQVFKYCCTSEKISENDTLIRIYDGNGIFTERIIPHDLTDGYIRCLTDNNYKYIDLR